MIDEKIIWGYLCNVYYVYCLEFPGLLDIQHYAGRAFRSDWSVSSFLMVVYKKIYRPPLKLHEGYVSSHVGYSVQWGRGSLVTITHGAFNLTIQGPPPLQHWPPSAQTRDPNVPPPRHGTSLYRDPLKYVSSEWYISYWNVFLYFFQV